MLNFDRSKKKKIIDKKKIIPGLGSRFSEACYRKQSIYFHELRLLVTIPPSQYAVNSGSLPSACHWVWINASRFDSHLTSLCIPILHEYYILITLRMHAWFCKQVLYSNVQLREYYSVAKVALGVTQVIQESMSCEIDKF